MKKNLKYNQYIALFSLFVFIFASLVPLQTDAARRSSSLSRKINKLDDDKVAELAVPILFGLTPDNLSRNFGDPRSGGRSHEGLDIMAPRGAPIVTPTDAVVIRVGTGDSAGKYVYTANPGGETFAYMHLDEIADIDEGDELSKGDLIGYVGNTGNAITTMPHLHFEIQDDGDATDPHPRFRRVFILADKIKYLEKILDDADSEKEEKKLAESLVALYRKELMLAQTQNIVLPKVVMDTLGTPTGTGGASITRVLQQGMNGDDVALLQTALGVTADGNFGPKTKAALAAFQISKGISPDGILGTATRVALLGAVPGCTATTLFSPLSGVKCN